jgi:MFS family permease
MIRDDPAGRDAGQKDIRRMSRDRSGVVDVTVVRLLLASFVVALATTGFIFSVPFYVLARLGRTDVVGQVVATWTFGYIVSCLVAQHLAHRLSPRILVTAATAGVAVFIFLFRLTATVGQMSAVSLFYGLFLGFFWAPLMGWLSGEAEGVSLSRRLGLFNLAWSSSVILAPLIASYLVRQSITLPFAVMTAVMAAACTVVLTTPYRTRRSRQSDRLSQTGPAVVRAEALVSEDGIRAQTAGGGTGGTDGGTPATSTAEGGCATNSTGDEGGRTPANGAGVAPGSFLSRRASIAANDAVMAPGTGGTGTTGIQSGVTAAALHRKRGYGRRSP